MWISWALCRPLEWKTPRADSVNFVSTRLSGDSDVFSSIKIIGLGYHLDVLKNCLGWYAPVIPVVGETEEGGLWTWSKPGLYGKNVSQK